MSAFPPHRSTPSLPISQEIALKYLSTYLTSVKSSPYLLPNARLEASGPTTGSSNSSITIHNLQRVEAGLQGEWLAPVLYLQEGKREANGMKIVTDLEENGQGDTMQVDGWQDLDEYQREQSIEEGEVGPRQMAIAIAQETDDEVVNEVDKEVEAEAPKAKKQKPSHQTATTVVNAKTSDKKVDKKARKLEKKQRRKQEKREREETRKTQAAAAQE